MEQQDILNEIIARAAVARVSMVQACKRAGIAPSTYYRWLAGADASLKRINDLRNAVDEMCGGVA